MARGRTQGTLGVAVSLQRPAPVAGEPTPPDADPAGEWYCFERGARKDSGGDGWADVWKRGCFAWEYKGPRANLDAAFNQLRQYAFTLENPPLLIVSDMARFRIRTNWTNSVSMTHDSRSTIWRTGDPGQAQVGDVCRLPTWFQRVRAGGQSFRGMMNSRVGS